MAKRATDEMIKVRALRTKQGAHILYMLFMPGSQILQVADIARLERRGNSRLVGFQRRKVREHVNEIAEYLGRKDVLFPNAIILALSQEVTFKQSRGPDLKLSFDGAAAGQLEIPIRKEGERVAWIVDGQQRSLALEKVKGVMLPVPVVAFESESVDMQRQQFILVNRARPLSQRLIDELLPATSGDLLPRDLKLRALPSFLCDKLNSSKDSPFHGIINRSSGNGTERRGVVTDTAIIAMIRRSLSNPNGALAAFALPGQETGDAGRMLALLVAYWRAVKEVFPEAWGRKPEQSRLMHSAGIAAMGDLMDRISTRVTLSKNVQRVFKTELSRIADDCAWTRGSWPDLDRSWDDIQSTPRDIKALSQTLVRLYAGKLKK